MACVGGVVVVFFWGSIDLLETAIRIPCDSHLQPKGPPERTTQMGGMRRAVLPGKTPPPPLLCLFCIDVIRCLHLYVGSISFGSLAAHLCRI